MLTTADAEARRRIASLRRQGSAAIQTHLRLALLKKISSRADLAALQQATHSTDVLLMLVEQIVDASDLPDGWREAAAETIGDMAAMFERRRYPIGIEPLNARTDVVLATEASALMDDFDAALIDFAVVPPQGADVPLKLKRGFFSTDAFDNPAHVRYAIKVTLAAMVCYLFYSLTDWSGIHTCLITCYIVALNTTGETIEKLSLRIVGAMAGAAVGLAAIIWLTPSIDHIESLLALVFVGGLAGGWIAAGSPRIAYAGFQVTFAIFLCVIQGPTPAFDLVVARDRVIGILLGNAVVYLIFVLVWPVSLARNVDPAISAWLSRLGRIVRLPVRAERLNALAEAHAALSKVDTDLEVVGYEPSALRPAPDWFADRKTLLAGMPALEREVLLCREHAARDAMSNQLDLLADAVDSGNLHASAMKAIGLDPYQMEQHLAH